MSVVSEDTLRLVFDSVPALIHTGRPDGYLDFFNQCWLDYVGRSLEDMSGWKWTAAIHPDDVAATVEKWRRAVATGKPFEHESRVRRADGEYRSVLHHKVPLRDDRGIIVRWYGSSIDIQDRKRAEETTRASAERWRAVFENLAVGIALTDPSGKYVASNRAYQEMMGYTDEELRARSYMDITYEEDREINRGLSTELWEGKRQQFQLEKRYRRKDGNLIWARATISAAAGLPGTSRFGMGVVEDITERKRAEHALRESEARFRALFQSVQVGVVVSGPNAENLSSNAAALEMLGVTEDQLRGITSFDGKWNAFYEDGTPCPGPEHPIPRAIATGQPVPNMVLGVDRPALGDRIWLLVSAQPQIASDGKVTNVICCFEDITERKRVEEGLQRSRDQLRALAARLQSAREAERTQVAREIHDELGQNLTAIKLELACLLRELPGDRKQQASRAESIVTLADETILALRRIATELRPGVLDEVGLVAAVRWAVRELQARTGTKCRLDLPKDGIVIDRERATALFRILQETLTNVARHANATQVTVTLAEEDGILTLEVHDNGKGITEEELSAGRSLGILGMRERALLLGGELDIRGASGRGTSVKVRIPEVDRREQIDR
jgi:PAS domain S-box-containing protein